MNLDELKQNLIDHLPDVFAEAIKAISEKNYANPFPMDCGFSGVAIDGAAKT